MTVFSWASDDLILGFGPLYDLLERDFGEGAE